MSRTVGAHRARVRGQGSCAHACADVGRARKEDAGKILADRITWFMQRLKVPNGLRALGYGAADIPALVEGTLPQHRVTKLSPRPAGALARSSTVTLPVTARPPVR